MNYRNLRHLIREGWGGGTPRNLASIGEEDGGADTGGAGGAADDGAADPTPEFGDAPTEPAAEAGGAPAAGAEGAEGAADPEPEPERPARVPWQNRRIDKLTAETKAAREEAERVRAEAAETKRKLDAYAALYGTDGIAAAPATTTPPAPAATGADGQRVYTQAEFDAEVQNRARLSNIDNTLDRWFDEGVATGGDAFKQKLAAAGAAFPQLLQRVDFFEAVTSLPNGAKVYETLAGDLDHFADVLEMSPLQLGLELGRLSTAAGPPAPKPKPRQISQVPDPINPISGQAGKVADPETETTEEYHARRERERQARFDSRGYA